MSRCVLPREQTNNALELLPPSNSNFRVVSGQMWKSISVDVEACHPPDANFLDEPKELVHWRRRSMICTLFSFAASIYLKISLAGTASILTPSRTVLQNRSPCRFASRWSHGASVAISTRRVGSLLSPKRARSQTGGNGTYCMSDGLTPIDFVRGHPGRVSTDGKIQCGHPLVRYSPETH